MACIPIDKRISDIEKQGHSLNRRIDKLQSDYDYLVESMISRPWANMTAQCRLLEEWNEEIESLKLEVDDLRKEWTRLNIIKNSKSLKKTNSMTTID